MTVANLCKVLPPPKAPTYAFNGPWEPIEAKIRTPLPQDYKDLMRLYGCGRFMDFFEIFGAAFPRPAGRLVPAVFEAQSMLIEHALLMHPQPGGMLACGNVDNSGYILWLARGRTPDEWPIVVWDHDPIEDEGLTMFECDLTDFIAGVVTGEIRFPGFRDLSEQNWGQEPFESTPDPWPYDI